MLLKADHIVVDGSVLPSMSYPAEKLSLEELWVMNSGELWTSHSHIGEGGLLINAVC